jgi:hypothetical protein
MRARTAFYQPFSGAIVTLAITAWMVGLTGKLDSAAGAEGNQNEQVETVVLNIVPARPPFRALRDHLLPAQTELKAGNAAPLYLKACLLVNQPVAPDSEVSAKDISKFLALPFDELLKSGAQKLVESNRDALDLIRFAAYHDRCDWDLPFREQSYIEIALPEVPPLRAVHRLLVLDTRLKFAKGDRAGALESTRAGLAFARHVAAAPTLVNGLVGAAIALAQLDTLREGIQNDPDNLYWALATLPAPFVDLAAAIEFEKCSALTLFPPLVGAATADRSPTQWQSDWEGIWKTPAIVYIVDDSPEPKRWPLPTKPDAAATAAMVARAKSLVASDGWSAEKIAAASDAQLLVAGTTIGYEHFSNEVFKRTGPWTPRDFRRREAEEAVIAQAKAQEVIPITSTLVAAVTQAQLPPMRLDREIAALAIVEALRNYAANHQGRLPAKLSDIEDMPIPPDPVVGKPFNYVVADNVATLSANSPQGRLAESWTGLKWEIHVNKQLQ